MLAHQLGFPLGYKLLNNAAYRIWQWNTLWKQAGFTTRPR